MCHERQIAVDDGNGDMRASAGAQHAQQLRPGIRVARQAQSLRIAVAARTDDLRHDVAALLEDVTRGMTVVAAHIAHLRVRVAEHRAGPEVELADLDIRRQTLLAQIARVIEIRHAGEHPLDRFVQRQRSEDAQTDRGIGLRPPVQRIDQLDRFAEPQWQTEHDLAADGFEHLVDGEVDIGKALWLRGHGRGLRWTRVDYARASLRVSVSSRTSCGVWRSASRKISDRRAFGAGRRIAR
jgi:hypothetical protein